MRLPTRFGPLSEREFRRYFAGQAVSLLGDGMAPLALAFAVLELTGSPTDLGFVFAARMFPWVAALLVGGVFADRLSRRGVMVGADLLRFGSQGVTALLLLTHTASLWQIVVLLAVPRNAPLPAKPFVRALVEGWNEFRSRVWLRTIVLAAGLINLMYTP